MQLLALQSKIEKGKFMSTYIDLEHPHSVYMSSNVILKTQLSEAMKKQLQKNVKASLDKAKLEMLDETVEIMNDRALHEANLKAARSTLKRMH